MRTSFLSRRPLLFLCSIMALCSSQWGCRDARPPAPVFSDQKLAEIDSAIVQAIASNKMPGAVFWLERNGSNYHKAYGQRSLVPAREPMTPDTIFDAASLTKVVATTPAILLLVERGRLDLDAPVQSYLPNFKGHGKEAILVRHLLTHTSGLRPGLSPTPKWEGYDKAIELACAEKLLNAPGTVFRYSDINFIVLGEIVRTVAGTPLNEFVAREIYEPLGMLDTGFLPPKEKLSRIAPTEKVAEGMLHGVVHDPTARRMGGVAGHAGLFTTASDLARFARMILNKGTWQGRSIFKPETIRLMTQVQTPESIPARRGLGWDIDSGYSRPRGKHWPLGSFGHTGWTGGSIWIDPFSESFWILLSNRVHPDGTGNILPLQALLGNLTAEAILGFNFAGVTTGLKPRPATPEPASPGAAAAGASPAPVLNGIDVLERDQCKPLHGLRVGLITNHTGTDRERRSTIDILFHAPGVQLKALFSPEHGIRGDRDETVDDTVDSRTGLPVYSLYGETRSPLPEHLRDLDALVFDIQDIGCRFYTYISTMGLAMEAAAKAKLKFFVLDRVNPINGLEIDGPVLNTEPTFTGFHPIPVRHGMTIGELARMFAAERNWMLDLTVVPLEGWSRRLWFDETGMPWTNPSPNMRNVIQAALYPGVGLLETTALSVGRGTDTPFQVVGAPYIDDIRFCAEMNSIGLPGVRFVPVRFTPNASVFKGQECRGAFISLLDRSQCRVVDIGIAMAGILHRLYPNDFKLDRFGVLLAHRATLDAIRAGKSLAEIREIWAIDQNEFKARRAKFLLYQ